MTTKPPPLLKADLAYIAGMATLAAGAYLITAPIRIAVWLMRRAGEGR